jgi:hypothetical protein
MSGKMSKYTLLPALNRDSQIAIPICRSNQTLTTIVGVLSKGDCSFDCENGLNTSSSSPTYYRCPTL